MPDRWNSLSKAIARVLIVLFASSILATNRERADEWPRLRPATNPNPFSAWNRASYTPILAPQDNDWESAGTFNPAVIFVNQKSDAPGNSGGKFVMLYRAQDKAGTSRLGYAERTNGIHFTRMS